MNKSSAARSQVVIFDSKMLAEQSYWKDLLSDLEGVAELRADFGRVATSAGARQRLEFSIGGATWEALRKIANGSDFLLYTVAVAALQVTLHKYTGGSKVVVGSPARVDGTAANEARNAVAIVNAVDPEGTFRDHLIAVRGSLLEAYKRQRYPLSRVLRDLGLDDSGTRCPLFDVSLRLNGIHGEMPATGCDLEITLTQQEDHLQGVIDYAVGVYLATTAARFAKNYAGFLGSALQGVNASVVSLSAMSSREQDRMTQGWNSTAADFPRDRCIHELFEMRAGTQPDRLAVVAGEISYTYRDLDRRANRLARLLAEAGTRRGDRVAVWVEASADMVVAVLAVLKAGASYVPLDVNWPCSRSRWILDHLDLSTLLLGRRQLDDLHEIEWSLPSLRHAVCVDVDEPEVPSEDIQRDAVASVWDFVSRSAQTEVDAAGFISSYTGQPFSAEEVEHYRRHTLDLCRPVLNGAARVLEIGCGSGLLMLELAPLVVEYVGLDPSPETQARNRERVAKAGLDHVRLVTAFADELDDFAPGSFELITIASTAQFFPGRRYFERVIGRAMNLLSPGGHIVLADLMDSRRRDAFQRSLEAFELQHRDDPDTHTKTERGTELYFCPSQLRDLAASVPEIAEVIIVESRDGFNNELRYRFDALFRRLHVGEEAPPVIARFHLETMAATTALSEEPLGLPGDSTDEAYVIHTSGSTGTPKGVVVRHRPVINLIHWVNRTYNVGPTDRLLFVTSLCFDLSVYDLFGTLAAGATIEVASEEDRLEPQRLVDLMRERPITFWDSAPAALQRLAPLFPTPEEGKTSLRLVFLSGDWIPVTLPDLVRFSFPAAHVVALGGATEATIWSNFHDVEEVNPSWVSIPYGRPIDNARYYILDSDRRPCPVGIPGELYIGGEVLADGYALAPEATAARFVPDPFASRVDARMYHTGDHAVFWEDGTIEFLGRLDQQIKIRGYRIELAEVEAALSEHQSVREVVAVAREETRGEKRIVAYLVHCGDHRPTASDFHRFLTERLPNYMVPSAYVCLDSLPLTANGKIDRAALPPPAEARPELREGYAEPSNEVEAQLAEIWSGVLGVQAIGMHDNFFELGGNSLHATQVLSRVRQFFDVELPLRHLFAAPSIAGLSTAISAASAQRRHSEKLVPIDRVTRAPASA